MTQIAGFQQISEEFIELFPLTEDLMLGVTAEREMWLINQTAEPKRATKIGIFTGFDVEKLKAQTTYVVHGGEHNPHFH